jgi:four helix bundle protein
LYAKSYKELDVYKNAYKLALIMHKLTLNFPKFEQFEEGSQLRRASKSIVSNIVEGYGRKKFKKEFLKFLIYALASNDETKLHLKFIYDCGYILKNQYREYDDKFENLGRQIYNLIESVDKIRK